MRYYREQEREVKMPASKTRKTRQCVNCHEWMHHKYFDSLSLMCRECQRDWRESPPQTEGVVITEEFLDRGRSPRGGWTRDKLSILGVEWPLVSGWKSRLLGTVISRSQARRFVQGENGLSHQINRKKKNVRCPVRMWFGMFDGDPVSELPKWYLEWLASDKFDGKTKKQKALKQFAVDKLSSKPKKKRKPSKKKVAKSGRAKKEKNPRRIAFKPMRPKQPTDIREDRPVPAKVGPRGMTDPLDKMVRQAVMASRQRMSEGSRQAEDDFNFLVGLEDRDLTDAELERVRKIVSE